MKRKKSAAKKVPEGIGVRQIVDLIDPPGPAVEPADPQLAPEAVPIEDQLSGVNAQLAKALEVATAECSCLAEKGATLAGELEVAKEQLLTVKARVRDLEGVLEHISRSVSCTLPTEEEGNSDLRLFVPRSVSAAPGKF